VTIPDYLTIPQARAFENSQAEAASIDRGKATGLDYIVAWLPGIQACVIEWGLDGFCPDPFQTTPRAAVNLLVSWLIDEIVILYGDATTIPNG
jgi:malate synthase